MDKLLAIVETLALESFWDRESDIERHLMQTKEISSDAKIVLHGNMAITYADIYKYVFRGIVTEQLRDFVEYMVELRQGNPEAIAFIIYTYLDPTTNIYVSDLQEILE